MYMLGISNYMIANYPDAITYLGKVTTEQDSLAQNAYIFIGHANLQQHQADKARMAFQNASLIDADTKLKEEASWVQAERIIWAMTDSRGLPTELPADMIDQTWMIYGKEEHHHFELTPCKDFT